MATHWNRGDVAIRRERLGLLPSEVPAADGGDEASAHVGVWLEIPTLVVDDTDEWLITYTPPGAPFGFPEGRWPTPDGRHPWHTRRGWQGHGCLMMQQPGTHHSIWHFWHGTERTFLLWYLNLQTAFVRTDDGYDTQDLELDIIFAPDGGLALKDDELLDERVADGRFSRELVDWIRGYGAELVTRLDRDGPWWDTTWAAWSPPPEWDDPTQWEARDLPARIPIAEGRRPDWRP